jgi:hypothetical protein
MEQILAQLLAKVKTIQEMMDDRQEKMKVQVGSLTFQNNVNQEKLMAKMDAQLEKMVACPGKTEATDLEATPEEIESEVIHKEVPKEKATVKTVRALKKQYRDWHLAIRYHGQLKKWTQTVVGPGGSWPLPAEG